VHRPLVKQIAHRSGNAAAERGHGRAGAGAGLLGLNQALSRFEKDAARLSRPMRRAHRRLDARLAARAGHLSRENPGSPARDALGGAAAGTSLGRPPRAMEVANELDWSLDEFHGAWWRAGAAVCAPATRSSRTTRTTRRSGADDHDDHAAIDEHADPAALRCKQRQRHAALSAAFDALEEAERYVMESIYKEDGMTLRDIGETLGVSESRVSRMASEIVAKLRLALRAW
jgi:RNA polymerase sigma factor for flagellar operon FliA